MEDSCFFVSSRGILKSCTFHSHDPESSCSYDFIYLIEMLKSNKMYDGMSIYVCSDLIRYFFLKILPQIKNNFILVTGDSDLSVPKDVLNIHEYKLMINNKYLLKWFAQNTQMRNISKMVQLPIGLDYHTISNNPNFRWVIKGEGTTPLCQEGILFNLRNKMKPFYQRNYKIYVNFIKHGNSILNQRVDSINKIPNELMEINLDSLKRTETWKNITKYAFVLSPFGLGMDCHRTWEALCLGAIPIVCAENFEKMFEDLPILNVKKWSDITNELLINTINEFKYKNFDYNKLSLNYWKKYINNTI
jgi:hypothetical protein